jgi:hypothetical protein
MNGHEIVVVGAAACEVEALCTIAAGLPADPPAAILAAVTVQTYEVEAT